MGPSDFQFAPAIEYLSCTNYWPPNPRKFILHAWKDLLIFAGLTHHLFIALWSNTATNKGINLKAAMTVKEIWNDAQQPTFYAIHAVTLGWFSFTATKHLPGQLHFQETLCKIHAFDNTQETKTQPCSKWRHLDWTLPWRHQLQPIIFSREENHIFNVCLRGVLKQKSTQEENFTNISIGNQIISSVILNK